MCRHEFIYLSFQPLRPCLSSTQSTGDMLASKRHSRHESHQLTRVQCEGQLAELPQQMRGSRAGEAAAPRAMLRTAATTTWRMLRIDMVKVCEAGADVVDRIFATCRCMQLRNNRWFLGDSRSSLYPVSTTRAGHGSG